MEILQHDTRFAKFVADHLSDESFMLVDVGCSGGIASHWRVFGSRLKALGFDPNVKECRRLQAQETSEGIEYIAAFVGADAVTEAHFAGRPRWGANPWDRLAVKLSIEARARSMRQASNEERTAANAWQLTELADSTAPIVLSDYLRDRGIRDVDFVKIDVDGEDLVILTSLQSELAELRTLGVCLEVNFYGTTSETDHTFHNMDRLMRAAEFELFDLTVRRYSVAALPSRYEAQNPAQSLHGRPLQGDAIH